MPRTPLQKGGIRKYDGGQASVSASAGKFRLELLLDKKGGDVGSRAQKIAPHAGQPEGPELPNDKSSHTTKLHANCALA